MTTQKEEFDRFVDRMAKIRYLSSPALYDFDDAQDYAGRLRRNFETIGTLASENREMLDNLLYPILESNEELPEELVDDMSEFGEKLLSLAGSGNDFENLDIPIMTLVTERLAADAEKKKDMPNMIRQLDAAFISYYSLMNITARISANPEICEGYRNRGLKIGDFFLDMVKKEKFLTVPNEELRNLVLMDARFVSALYENCCDEESNNKYLDLLDRMMKISADPFYAKAVPGFDWKYFQFRVLSYYLQATDDGNKRQFNKEQIKRILAAADAVETLIASDRAYFKSVPGADAIPFLCARTRFFAGQISEAEYRSELMKEYERRDSSDFGPDGNFDNILIPLEFLSLFSKRRSSEDRLLLKTFYRNISAYMFGMPNAGALSFLMEYFTGIVQRFYEIPSILTFEDFGLQTLAALHPPTYIHSMMVGQITECLCGYVIENMPEVLVGVLDTKSTEEVVRKRNAILSFAYHAALCHDFGKILIIDTIFVYGRRLLDFEFDIIKSHPVLGSELLKKHESTKAYADVALGHHRFYDDSRGYPEEFKTSESKDKAIIDIVMCADCMDAATDSVGRSYNKGKTLTEYIKEVEKECGTRYAPWLPKLLSDTNLRADLMFLLSEGREANYRDTYLLLK
ncbi:MAG: HD domain-containing protein, partial [Lachnospiraceae bacterium]|nr:HD domain-containing protein [Lachnospiraceae bacterium]